MYILALDTTTESCSVALGALNSTISLSTKYLVEPRMHANLILPMIDEVLSDVNIKLNQIQAVAFGRGPGAFTGLRIAAGVVQGLACGLNCKVLAISTLAAIAQRAHRKYNVHQVAVCIDARMNEVYCACFKFQNNEMRLLGKEQVLPPTNFKLDDRYNYFGAGTGWSTYKNDLPQVFQQDGTLLVHAEDILTLAQYALKRGEQINAEDAHPIYLRNNIATPKK